MTAFASAAEAWLWYCQALAMRNAGGGTPYGPGHRSSGRGCELSDVVAPVPRLVRAGRLTERHLRVLRRYGVEQREPVAAHAAEAADAALWTEALDRLGAVWRRKEIVP